MLDSVPSLSKLPSSCTSWGTPCGWCCAVNLITRTSLSCLCTGCPAPFTQNKPLPFVRDAASVSLQFRGWRYGHAGGTGFWTTIKKATVRIPPAIWIYADVFRRLSPLMQALRFGDVRYTDYKGLLTRTELCLWYILQFVTKRYWRSVPKGVQIFFKNLGVVWKKKLDA